MTKKDLSDKQKDNLEEVRHKLGLYSIIELSQMFNCHRNAIDYALNTGKLKYISPNRKDRFIYLNDYLEYMANNQ